MSGANGALPTIHRVPSRDEIWAGRHQKGCYTYSTGATQFGTAHSQCVMPSQINWVIKWLQLFFENRSKAVTFNPLSTGGLSKIASFLSSLIGGPIERVCCLFGFTRW